LEVLRGAFNGNSDSDRANLFAARLVGIFADIPLYPMEFKTRTLQELRDRRGSLPSKHAILGLDGFVDTIVTPVGLRAG